MNMTTMNRATATSVVSLFSPYSQNGGSENGIYNWMGPTAGASRTPAPSAKLQMEDELDNWSDEVDNRQRVPKPAINGQKKILKFDGPFPPSSNEDGSLPTSPDSPDCVKMAEFPVGYNRLDCETRELLGHFFRIYTGLSLPGAGRSRSKPLTTLTRVVKDVIGKHQIAYNGEEHRFSELRIVLLGRRESSAGNTILGREEFESGIRTAQCVKRQGEVAERQVTVVDTSGWWKTYSVNGTRELDKQEIVRSVSLCPPGPCALFLVIDVSSAFRETHRRSVVEHLELLSERVWRHTIVLFTWEDWLGDTTIEQHIETEGRALQELIEKCGNRYHVLNNKNRVDGTQVTELLEKIEEMVVRNRGVPFTIKEREGEGLLLERKKFEEEWRRREEELIERMLKMVVDSEREGSTLPFRKRRHSLNDLPPSFSGGTPAPSEAGSSV